MFTRAFTAGLRDASLNGRVTEGTWRRVLLVLHDCVCGWRVAPGQRLGMRPMRIDFGPARGQIRQDARPLCSGGAARSSFVRCSSSAGPPDGN